MLVLCYGMQKSGSTLAFELTCGVLQSAGFAQDFIRSDVHAPREGRVYRNFVGKFNTDTLNDLIATIGPSRKIAVKTHSGFTDDMLPQLEASQAKRELQIIASYRDPRDVCLSLLDAGRRDRDAGKGFFAQFDTLESAARFTKTNSARFRRWAALRGALRLSYEQTAYDTEAAIVAIESVLGIQSDHAQVLQHAFVDAFTQKNKAVRTRYKTEMTDAQKGETEKMFRPFIRNACKRDNQAWYDKYRDEMLSRIKKT